MKSAAEILAEARKFDTGIAEWIDAQIKLGRSPENIVNVLKATTALAKAEREFAEAAGVFGRQA